MKKLLILIIISFYVFIACQNENNSNYVFRTLKVIESKVSHTITRMEKDGWEFVSKLKIEGESEPPSSGLFVSPSDLRVTYGRDKPKYTHYELVFKKKE